MNNFLVATLLGGAAGAIAHLILRAYALRASATLETDASLKLPATAKHPTAHSRRLHLLALLATIPLLATFFLSSNLPRPTTPLPHTLTRTAFAQGQAKCAAIARRTAALTAAPPAARTRNPRFTAGADAATLRRATVIRNATLWDGVGGEFQGATVALVDGLVHAVKVGAAVGGEDFVVGVAREVGIEVGDVVVLDVEGRFVTPGLVDMHSHAGTDSWPGLDATSDTNEMSDSPTVPQVRTIDAINPHDPAFGIINS
ncbi:hypothetical protein BDK51DRAFT_35159, partial [Blyttiomyces helicus]